MIRKKSFSVIFFTLIFLITRYTGKDIEYLNVSIWKYQYNRVNTLFKL
jgi:hypothetical protein